ncbi:threonine/serine exporter family protein, partial [Streptococcus suis]|uniref:threonine/serine exporter family protein n=1 Tax=Streptococcus suis TaxID=1307 RepID=UPI003CF19EB8
GQLHEVHTIYRRVVHDECSVDEGAEELSKLLKQKPIYGVWARIMIAGGLCFLIAPMSFGGSIVDALASACFGILV